MLRKYGKAFFRKAVSPAAQLSAFAKIAALLLTHTLHVEEAQTIQFSATIPLGPVATTSAAITPARMSSLLRHRAAGTLIAYAEALAGETWQPIPEPATLVPPMLERFIASEWRGCAPTILATSFNDRTMAPVIFLFPHD